MLGLKFEVNNMCYKLRCSNPNNVVDHIPDRISGLHRLVKEKNYNFWMLPKVIAKASQKDKLKNKDKLFIKK